MKEMKEHLPHLLSTVKDGSAEDIWEAAKELSAFATEMVHFLIPLLRNAERADTRAAAAYVLGFGRFASARAPLEELLNDIAEEPSVRGHAAEALAYIHGQESVDILIKHLKDKSVEVKYWCTFALGEIGDAKAASALKHLAGRVQDNFFQEHSLKAEALDAIAKINRRMGTARPNG